MLNTGGMTLNTLQSISQEMVELSGRLIGEKVLITDTAGIIIGCTDSKRIGELQCKKKMVKKKIEREVYGVKI